MEPTNHPSRKENDLNQTSMIMFHVNLPGSIGLPVAFCSCFFVWWGEKGNDGTVW